MEGTKILTFAQLLKYARYPLAEVVKELLRIGKAGMGGDVEIEFALHLDPDPEKSTFYFLQIRPMITGGEMVDVQICDHERELSFCRTDQSLGHGSFENMTDIVYVCPDLFDPAKTREIASEIGELNRKLEQQQRPYLLIGPGRWGSNDPWLGIPVQWSDISGVTAIIEVRNETLRADPSQGTHFFQNITSLEIPYLTLDETDGASETNFMDWKWLQQRPEKKVGRYVCHVQLKEPFVLKCDGTTSESVIFQVNSPCKMLCKIQGREVWNPNSMIEGDC